MDDSQASSSSPPAEKKPELPVEKKLEPRTDQKPSLEAKPCSSASTQPVTKFAKKVAEQMNVYDDSTTVGSSRHSEMTAATWISKLTATKSSAAAAADDDDGKMNVDYGGSEESIGECDVAMVHDLDDVTTEGEKKSRASSHRSSCTASKGVQEKKLRKFKEHMQKVKGADFCWTKNAKESTAEERAAAVLLLPINENDVLGKNDVLIYDSEKMKAGGNGMQAVLDKATLYQFSSEELYEIAVEREKAMLPRFQYAPRSQEQRMDTHRRFMHLEKDGWFRCRLCGNKYADDAHVNSKEHTMKLDEMTSLDEMLGVSLSARRFSPTPGLMVLADQQSFRQFWGSEVENLTRILMDRLARGHTISVRWSKSGKPKVLTLNDIESVKLMAVSFEPGKGKYIKEDPREVQDRAVAYDDLPPVAARADYGHFDRLIDDDAVKLADPVPRGHGWWPVVQVNWKTQADDFDMSREEYFRKVKSGHMPLFAPCKYQIADGPSTGSTIEAWPIRLTSRL